MPGAKFFPDARLNFAENLLRRADDGAAIVFRGEDKARSQLTWAQLQALVSRLQQAMKAAGVGVGDRVAAMLPNMPEAIAAMLAATSIGAIWSSCSPDFGERGVLDRFGQIEPKLFITVDGYWYNGKAVRIVDKLKTIVAQLDSAATRGRRALSRRGGGGRERAAARGHARRLHRSPSRRDRSLTRAFPSIIPSISSIPPARPACRNASCMAPAARLLQHLKEHQLQCDLRAGERAVLFHHARLDDVELARLGARERSDAAPL